MMKARTLELQTKVFSSMEENAVTIATLPAGTEIDFGPARRRAGKLWVPITLSTGQQAFIPGESRIYLIQLGNLAQNDVELHDAPSGESPIKQRLARNTRVYILQVIKGGEKEWVKVRDMNGTEGYIPGDTRIRLIQQKTKALGMRNVRTGILWLVAGLIIIFSGASRSTGSIYYMLGYAAVVYGIAVFGVGLYTYLKAPS